MSCYDSCPAVPVAIRQIQYDHNIPQAHNHNLLPPTGFTIDFAYWKPTVKVVDGVHMTAGHIISTSCSMPP